MRKLKYNPLYCFACRKRNTGYVKIVKNGENWVKNPNIFFVCENEGCSFCVKLPKGIQRNWEEVFYWKKVF